MILALDTATRQISLALHDGRRLLAEHTWRVGQTHSVELAPQAALMLRRAEVAPGALTGVAVALGPGSYTALRIGLGFAKGLALAHNLALYGVPTFEIILRPLRPEAGLRRVDRALALLQAGRGRAVAAAYAWDGREWAADGPPRGVEWAALTDELHGPILVCGEWEAAPPELLRAWRSSGRALFEAPAQALRRAGYLAEIAWERRAHGQADDVLRLAPLYAGAPFAYTPPDGPAA
ncbi:MAG: tRNA (adenosine(37)-N6)-threonylcarbamoyltransferase complex dimerization subunit type 1 TsaB [Anaerolineales bacterium]|nr:tRNA (adenosine(37)-N6)-threonylcarbamoyltransferase complex dimerization subunit type 1 TsaB [Anaerolineales bacterium]